MVEGQLSAMIIFPIIILALLITTFAIVWRRAYLMERQGKIEEEPKPTKPQEKQEVSEDLEEGEGEIEIKPKLDPNFAKAEELFGKRQYISAEKWYLEAVKNNPKNPKIYARLAVIYIEQNNLKDAEEALKVAIELEPDVASRHFNLSYVYNSMGKAREAIAAAKRAVKLDGDNLKYRQWLNELRSRPF